MISFDQFRTNTNGLAVTYDNVVANYGQCEQLVCLYWAEVYEYEAPLIPYAYELYTNPDILENFTQIPLGQEQAGDVAVFGKSSSINSPVAGHTDIVISATSGGFIGWDSNWGGVTDTNKGTPGYGYPAAHQVTHTNNDVLGFLRFKGEDMNPTSTQVGEEFQALAGRQPTQAEVDLFIGLNWFDGLNQYLFPGVEQTREQVTNLENERDNVLYPFVNAVCADLNIPITTDITTVATAITALQKAGTTLNATNVEAYIQEHLS